MKNKEIKLVMSDIDGTILDDNHQIDNELKDTLKMLQKKDIPFVLASARSPKGIYQIAEDLEITAEPLACYNGALILENADKDNYKPIFSHELAIDEVKQIIHILKKEFPDVSINLYTGRDWFVQKFDKWVEIEANITNEEPLKRDIFELTESSDLTVHKLLLIGTSAEIKKVHQYLEHLNLEKSSFYFSKENYLEITNTEVTKERALLELSDFFKVPLENILTMGDNFNDVPMLSLAGIGVAMGNSPDEVKESADIIAPNNNQNGATKVIEKYVLKH